FSLPAVVNECMMQSYSGAIRLFPNSRGLGPARFQNLRAMGAFLVSAAWDGKSVSPVTLVSEKGVTARIANPWGAAAARVVRLSDNAAVETQTEGGILIFHTAPNEHYRVGPA
ncbi:MAG: glycoside hydrolase family 95-like protein, partial [Terriglobia bacterium]